MSNGRGWAFFVGLLVGAVGVGLYVYRSQIKAFYDNADKIDPATKVATGLQELWSKL